MLRRALWTVALLALGLTGPAPLAAQDNDQRGFLAGLIEDALSGAGREVRIEGFAGLLTSRASLEKMTIADGQGIWLTLEDATLDWDRGALLSGRLAVTEISARRLQIDRAPVTEDSLPEPETQPFKLPDLPVAVEIGTFSLGELHLGAPLLGTPITLTAAGRASLAAGSGAAALEVSRTDGTDGALTLDARYTAETDVLALDLILDEPRGGLLATSLNLRGAPALNLELQGESPLTDYSARLKLVADGNDRLQGTVRTTVLAAPEGAAPAPASRRTEAQLSGNLAPLLAPDYSAFLGDRISLDAMLVTGEGRNTEIERFNLRADAVTLGARGALDSSGWPLELHVAGMLGLPTGTPVQLPLPGEPVTVEGARFVASFSDGRDNPWQVALDLRGAHHPALKLGTAQVALSGRIERAAGRVTGMTGRITGSAEGMALSDPGLDAALGDNATLAADLRAGPDEPLRLTNMQLQTLTARLSGDLSLGAAADGLPATADLSLTAPRLAAFSGLAQRPLSGQAQATLSGQGNLLEGSFDASFDARTQDLSLSIARLDALLAGAARVKGRVARGADGLRIDGLSAVTPRVRIALDGVLATAGTDLRGQAALTDLGLLAPEVPGRAQLDVRVRSQGDRLRTTLTGSGPAGLTLRLDGTIAPDGSDADLSGQAQARLEIVNGFVAPRRLEGPLSADLRLRGPLTLTALSGAIRTSGARLSEPSVPFSITDIGGSVGLANGQAILDLVASGSDGGRITLQGPIVVTAPFSSDINLSVDGLVVRDARLYETSLDGAVRLNGPLTGGAVLQGQISLGPTEIRLTQTPGPAAGDIPGLIHVGPGATVLQTLDRAGARKAGSTGSGTPLGVDLTIDAPGRIFVRGRGLDAELGGQVRLRGTTADLRPDGQFSLVRGRFDVLGRRLILDEAAIVLRGRSSAEMRAVASTTVDQTEVSLVLQGPVSEPELSLESSPPLPEDEAFALLIFGRGSGQLSPLQAAQLALAIDSLRGGDVGVLEKLRQGTGFDDLDIRKEGDEATQLQAGKYLTENTYGTVGIDTQGRSEVTLNLDLTDDITLRGSVDSTDRTGVGFFFERDY